jgi:small nuclear ribonucleoprotein
MKKTSINSLGLLKKMAIQILEESLGKTVLIRLRGGKSIRGKLKGFDQHLNLVLEKAEDVTDMENIQELGLIIVRGDNVVMISPPPR